MAAQVKLFHRPGSRWVEHTHLPTFAIESTSAKANRLVAGLPAREACTILAALVDLVEPPYFLLYVLHTPRGEGEPGRYMSPLIDRDSVKTFLRRFKAFLTADSRFDLWIHSRSDDTTLVWDRHNVLFAYGDLEQFSTALRARGFGCGRPSLDFEHVHHYRAKFDTAAAELLETFDWGFSPLKPEDRQI